MNCLAWKFCLHPSDNGIVNSEMTLQSFDDFFSKFNCQSEINYFKDSIIAEFIDYVYF